MRESSPILIQEMPAQSAVNAAMAMHPKLVVNSQVIDAPSCPASWLEAASEEIA